ncbi:MAG: leucine-rich repeat domain-containing protein [Bacteroidales bacterium]|nr:leucine-rich repeat domain-containing protein [Bacteroidales bacterium]
MKQFLCTLLLLAIISPINAYDFQSGDLYYNITSSTDPFTVEVIDCEPNLTTATIPETVTYNGTIYSVTSIGNEAFYGCSSLTSVTIGNSVTSIGGRAFYGCSSLTSVTIGNSVTSIGNDAFSGCSALTSITIPNSVTSIGWSAFYNCDSLTKTNYTGDIAGWCKIKFDNYTASPIYYSHNLYINDQEIKDLVIPNTVDSIQNYAFYECFSLKSVTIPNSVKSIGYHTFYRCCFLKKDFVNNSPLDAEENGYWGARVGEIEVDGMIIQGTIVVGCRKNVTNATIPNYITSIGSDAFAKCSSLTLVIISSRINSIGSGAFDGCDALTKTNYLGDIAGWCAIKFGGSSANPISNSHNLYINNQEIRDLVIPNTVDSIHNDAFYECFSLTSVSIGNSVMSIGYDAFGGCSSLSSVTIGNSVTSIGDYAFSNCSSLTSINIPESVTSIGKNAFSNCSSLTSINIPESVTNIWYGAFDNTGIYNDESNWENNVLYIDNCLIALKCYIEGEYTIKDGVRLVAGGTFWNQNNMTKVNFPNSVKSISSLAFSGINIAYLEIPNNVKNIEERAFDGCRYLSTVTLGDGLTCIEDKVFRGCRALTSITIPNSIKRVGVSSFENCSSLTSVTIGNGVTNIGKYAFYRCDRLSDIYCYATLLPSSQESSFPHYYAYVYVPCESIQLYRADNVWGKFQNLQCLDTEETDIENVKGSSQTLNNCNKLLRNGQLLIQRDGKTYNVMGQEL